MSNPFNYYLPGTPIEVYTQKIIDLEKQLQRERSSSYGYIPNYKPINYSELLGYKAPAKENEMEVKKTTVEFKQIYVPGYGDVKATQNANKQWVISNLITSKGTKEELLALSRDGLKALHALIQNLLFEDTK